MKPRRETQRGGLWDGVGGRGSPRTTVAVEVILFSSFPRSFPSVSRVVPPLFFSTRTRRWGSRVIVSRVSEGQGVGEREEEREWEGEGEGEREEE